MKESLILQITTAQEKDKPLNCKIFQNIFGEINKLKGHQRTVHENEKPFKCDIL